MLPLKLQEADSKVARSVLEPEDGHFKDLISNLIFLLRDEKHKTEKP